MKFLAVLLFAVLLAACSENIPTPSCLNETGEIVKVDSILYPDSITSVALSNNTLYVTFDGNGCSEAYLAYALEIRSNPPQYYLFLQGVEPGDEPTTKLFNTQRFIPGSRLHIAGQTFVTPSR